MPTRSPNYRELLRVPTYDDLTNFLQANIPAVLIIQDDGHSVAWVERYDSNATLQIMPWWKLAAIVAYMNVNRHFWDADPLIGAATFGEFFAIAEEYADGCEPAMFPILQEKEY